MNREKTVVKTGLIGVLINVILVLIKLFVALITNSIAIATDAINNLTDVISAVVSIIGIKLASKPADKEHPFGHGRIEYITEIVIAVLIMFTGIQFMISSFGRIFEPEPLNFTSTNVLLLIIALILKLFLAFYVRKMSIKVKSDSLKATSVDAFFDAVITTITILAAIFNLLFHINVDGYLGLLFSIIILKVSFDMIKSSIDNILGKRVSNELSVKIKKEICEYENVLGAYDLILNDYGPTNLIGSVNIEMYDYLTVKETYKITYKMQQDFLKKYNAYLVFGIYSINTTDQRVKEMNNKILNIVYMTPDIVQIHAFNVNFEKKLITFDLIFDFNVKEKKKELKKFKKTIKTMYPDFDCYIKIESYYSD